jgi:hypothetical protein
MSNLTRTIAYAIESALFLGLKKPADIALTIQTELDQAGYRIVRKPKEKP